MWHQQAYSIFMVLSLGAFFLTRWLIPVSEQVGKLPLRSKFHLALAGFVGGTLGAKIPFWLGLDPNNSSWLGDGKTVTTGLIGAYLCVESAKWFMGITFKTGDSFALPLAVAMSIGRWGCFFNGCCHGVPTTLPWGVDFGDHIQRHPTQIYESLFHFVMAGVLLGLTMRKALPGHKLQLYLISYGIYRFATEFIRPEPRQALGLTFYQFATLILVVGLATQWIWESRREKEPVIA